ncbi:hypothetical protein M758_5G077800 [Ceratodon purpureus]|nr:hypothetical protein M758_5G077800 [Ceratodon purpureus]
MESSTPSPRGRNLGPSASFRESDVEFLQTEAREWLEAVLEEKLDPGTSLQDLLADGTVLYRVSQIVKEHLSKVKGRHTEHLPAGAIPSPDVNRRTSLKYQPYSYVEAFLKVCKDVGLLDLDLFNPSDAVDKKDIRHVCVCLRRLSKKARTLNVQLPEFDNGKHSLLRSPSHKHTTPVEESLQQPSNKTPSRFKNEELGKEPLPSIADLQKRDSDPNDISLELDVVSDENPLEVLQESDGIADSNTMEFANEGEADVKVTISISEDTDSRSVETTISVSEETESRPMETTTTVCEDLRPVETTTSVSEGFYLELVQTSVSDERNLAMSEKPHVNGLEMTYEGDRSPPALDLCVTKEKRRRKGWRPWFPYAAGAAVFVGAVVVLVVSKEKRQSSPVLYEVQSGDNLAEIVRQTQKSY